MINTEVLGTIIPIPYISTKVLKRHCIDVYISQVGLRFAVLVFDSEQRRFKSSNGGARGALGQQGGYQAKTYLNWRPCSRLSLLEMSSLYLLSLLPSSACCCLVLPRYRSLAKPFQAFSQESMRRFL